MTNVQQERCSQGVDVAHTRQGRFVAPGDWEREVPYDIRERTFQFAVRVLKAVRQLPDDSATRVVAYQLTKSATSVGANVEEADGAESRRDFVQDEYCQKGSAGVPLLAARPSCRHPGHR